MFRQLLGPLPSLPASSQSPSPFRSCGSRSPTRTSAGCPGCGPRSPATPPGVPTSCSLTTGPRSSLAELSGSSRAPLAAHLAKRGKPPAPARLSSLRGVSSGDRRRRLRPRATGRRAHRSLGAAGDPIVVECPPNSPSGGDLTRDLAAHPRRAHLLGPLRDPKLRPAPHYALQPRRDRQHAHADARREHRNGSR